MTIFQNQWPLGKKRGGWGDDARIILHYSLLPNFQCGILPNEVLNEPFNHEKEGAGIGGGEDFLATVGVAHSFPFIFLSCRAWFTRPDLLLPTMCECVVMGMVVGVWGDATQLGGQFSKGLMIEIQDLTISKGHMFRT